MRLIFRPDMAGIDGVKCPKGGRLVILTFMIFDQVGLFKPRDLNFKAEKK